MPDLYAVAPACWPMHPHIFDLQVTRQAVELACDQCFRRGDGPRKRRRCPYRIPKRARRAVTVELTVKD